MFLCHMTPYNVAHARLGSSRLSAVPFEFVVAAVTTVTVEMARLLLLLVCS